MSELPRGELPRGELLALHIDAVAHGGHCVARHEGRVVFVRHTLPGEDVLARVTGRNRRYWRADAVQIDHSAPDRVLSPWPAAGPGGVGGAELAHVSLAGQRRWKAAVISQQLRHHLGIEDLAHVQALPAEEFRGGLGYRSRVDLVADGAGRLGMSRHRSEQVQALDDMPLAAPEVRELGLFSRTFPAGARVRAISPSAGAPLVMVNGEPFRMPGTARSRYVAETVELSGPEDRRWSYRVAADSFWQAHRAAPSALVHAVLAAVADVDLAGQTVLDLFSGAGLFTQPLADAVGPHGRVVAIEGDAGAVRDARRNAHALRQVELVPGEVAQMLAGAGQLDALPAPPAVVVLDPPRVGARAEVVTRIARMAPQRVVYVACDPVALARDLATFHARGYQLRELQAFDLFPMTHHVECVAVLDRAQRRPPLRAAENSGRIGTLQR